MILAPLPHQSIWKRKGANKSISFNPFKKMMSLKKEQEKLILILISDMHNGNSLSNETFDLSMKMVPALGCNDGSASQSSGSLSLICCKLPTLSCSLGKYSSKCGTSFRPGGGLECAQQLFLLPMIVASLVPELC